MFVTRGGPRLALPLLKQREEVWPPAGAQEPAAGNLQRQKLLLLSLCFPTAALKVLNSERERALLH